MTTECLEMRLRQNGQTLRENVRISIELPSECSIRRKNSPVRVLILAAVLSVILAFSAIAAYRYYSAAELAVRINDQRLSERFRDADVLSETVESGAYRITLLGSLAGTNISDRKTHAGAQLVAYVAVERADGSAMTYDDHIVVSPLYSDMAPSEANTYTDSGSGWYFLEDGVLYYGADLRCRLGYEKHDLYLAVSDSPPGAWNYLYDEETDKITSNPTYSGTNALFLLQKAEK